jgi:pimeloyl-ACP methyl ester carboxylesterase
MKRRWKILIGLVVVLAALLAINTVIVDQQTKPAEVTVEDGEILELPGGDVQVTNLEAKSAKPGAPIVLIHCYSCSLNWWDAMVPLLNERHRVVRIDLLGHGGSEKPSSGYGIEEQAGLVAASLNELDVQGAVVVGHSLGGAVATALAEQSSQLVDRVTIIDEAPDDRYGSLPFLATLGYTPVIGEAMWRTTPDFLVKDTFQSAFAPDFDIDSGFEDPDQVVDDYNAMTYTSFDEVATAADEFTAARPLNDRLKSALVPLLVIFGEDDQIVDAGPASEAYRDVPGARIALIPGAGHSPNVEKPEETANLLLEFADEAGDEVVTPPRNVGLPSASDRRPSPNRPDGQRNKNRQGSGGSPGAGQEQGGDRQGGAGKGSN